MNPDKEDPNNHVPAVTDDDDWDGLDLDQTLASQLPPRRADAPRIAKMDVNLSAFKATEPVRQEAGATSHQDDAQPKSLVSMDIHLERVVSEKDDFQAALVMESVKQGDEAAKSYEKRPVKQSRFTPGERDEWGVNHPQKGTARWMLFTAAGVICLIALTVFLNQFAGKKPVRKSDMVGLSQLKPAEAKEEPIRDPGMFGQLASQDEDAFQIYGQYAQAKSADDFLKSIYLSERNTPLVMDAWKPMGAESGWIPSSTSTWKPYKDGELVYAELRGVNYDFSKFLAFFRYENSDLKLDWKATTGYGTASFDDLKIGQGDGSEVRGWISSANFFTQQLPDDRYHSFILRSHKLDDSLWIYTEIGSAVDKDIMALFSISPITGQYQTDARVTLNLERGDEKTLPSQWMIKGLIAENWLDQATP